MRSANLFLSHLLYAFWLVLSPVLCPSRALGYPLKASLSGDLAALRSPPKDLSTLRFKLTAREGTYRFLLRARRGFGFGGSAAMNTLFWGKQLTRRASPARNTGVSLSLSGDRIKLNFFSKRRASFRSAEGRFSHRAGDLSDADRVAVTFSSIPKSIARLCGVSDSRHYQNTAQRSPQAAALFSPPRVIDISVESDSAFFERVRIRGESFSRSEQRARDEVREILNTAQSLYLSQLGIKLNIRDNRVDSFGERPYRSISASALLLQFKNFAEANNHLESADIYHLITGKELNEGIVGLAFVGTTCQHGGTLSYGLSSVSAPKLNGIVTAHEIAHNLNATHFNSTSSIMSAQLNTRSTKFEEFSRSEISDYIGLVDCLAEHAVLTLRKTISANTLTFLSNFIGIDPARCETRLYASTQAQNLQAGLGSEEHIWSSGQDTGNDPSQLSTVLELLPPRNATIFFRTVSICANQSTRSNIIAFRPSDSRRTTALPRSSVAEWIQHLSQMLSKGGTAVNR